jgi:hypothetical protein
MLCLTCHRVRPAATPAEYTVLRAHSITTYGLCACDPRSSCGDDTRIDPRPDAAVIASVGRCRGGAD